MVVSHSNFDFRLEIIAEHVKASVLVWVMCLEFLSKRAIIIVISAWGLLLNMSTLVFLFG